MRKLGASLSWKTARGRFELLINSFRRSDRLKRTQSGVDEEFGEKEQLLQDMVEERNDKREGGDGKADRKMKEEDLIEAAKGLRDASIARRK